MQDRACTIFKKILPQNLELVDTHVLNSGKSSVNPGSDGPHNMVDFAIVLREEKFKFQCFSPCFVEVKKDAKRYYLVRDDLT